MKHRNPILILLAAFFLIMSACAAPPSPSATESEPPATAAPEPEESPEPAPSHKSPTELIDAIAAFPEFSAERTAAMSSWAEYGFGIVDDNTYYGRFFLKGDPAPMLFSLELKSGNRSFFSKKLTIKFVPKKIGKLRFNTGGDWENFVCGLIKVINTILCLICLAYPFIYKYFIILFK